jgi:hypothetical protein
MSCDTVERRYDLISFILLKERSRDATDTGDVSEIWSAVANVLHASNRIDEMSMSGPFGWKSIFPLFSLALSREWRPCGPDVPIHSNLLNTFVPN